MDEKVKQRAPLFYGRVLLHEYVMSFFLLQIILRLIFSSKFEHMLFYYVLAAITYWGLIYFGIKTMSVKINRVRLFSNFFLMDFTFASIKYIVPMLGMTTKDYILAGIDKTLIGEDLSLLAQKFYSRPLTEIMSLGYLLHFVPFMLALIYYAFIADMGKGSVFYGGMFSVIGIGFLGYTLMPAEGPFVYFNGQYTKELTGYYITMLNNVIVKAGSAKFDVFPSLHTGVALYLLMSFYSHNKKIFLLYLPLFITIIYATVYLRYHYFFDLACGAMLCVTCFYLSSLINNYASKSEANMNTRYERM